MSTSPDPISDSISLQGGQADISSEGEFTQNPQ